MRESRRLVKTSTKGIYKRGNGYVVRYRDPSGKDRKRCALTQAEARRIQSELRADIGRGEYRTTTRITFEEYAVAVLDELEKPKHVGKRFGVAY